MPRVARGVALWWVWKRERLALASAETDIERSVGLSRCLAPARDANSGKHHSAAPWWSPTRGEAGYESGEVVSDASPRASSGRRLRGALPARSCGYGADGVSERR